LLCLRPELSALLIGRGGEAFAAELAKEHPNLAQRICATGELEQGSVSVHLQACDVFLQPYADGATSRRTSLMAALAHGKPIVTSQGRHTEPVWSQSGGVKLVANDSDEQIRAVQALLEDTAARDRLGAAASALYDSRFDLRHTVAALRGLVK
jgi:glycosyltransferase involved in cell wall biosynthesis